MATNPAGAAETTVAGDAAAALPPQLNEMLGGAASKVASFAELVRGVSWTQQLMEDVSHQLFAFTLACAAKETLNADGSANPPPPDAASA